MVATYTYATAGGALPVGVAKQRVYIGTKAVSPTNDAFTEIADVESFPGIGGSAELITTKTLTAVIYSKGTVSFGTGDMTCVIRNGDAGQAAVVAAGNDFSGTSFNFRIIGPDVASSTGTGTIRDIKALVMGTPVQYGTGSNVLMYKAALGFNSDFTATPAT